LSLVSALDLLAPLPDDALHGRDAARRSAAADVLPDFAAADTATALPALLAGIVEWLMPRAVDAFGDR